MCPILLINRDAIQQTIEGGACSGNNGMSFIIIFNLCLLLILQTRDHARHRSSVDNQEDLLKRLVFLIALLLCLLLSQIHWLCVVSKLNSLVYHAAQRVVDGMSLRQKRKEKKRSIVWGLAKSVFCQQCFFQLRLTGKMCIW